MRPPFTTDEFFQVFVRYHEQLWPAPLVLLAIGTALVVLALAAPHRSRLIVGGLAALWGWMAIAYHFAFFAALTPMAWVFGALSLAEGALLAWHGLHTRRLHFAAPLDWPARLVGGALAVYALVGYPIVANLLGQHFPIEPTFGLPCPTTILTFALLTWCVRPVPWSVLLIPIGWTLVATSAAVTFGIGEDFGLPIAAALTLAVLLHPYAHHAHTTRPTRPLQLGF